jgi:hypothetical protein
LWRGVKGSGKCWCAFKEQYILVQASKILPTIFLSYGVHPSVDAVLGIFSAKKKTYVYVKLVKGAKLEGH